MRAARLLSALSDPGRLQLFGRICADDDGLPAADIDAPPRAVARLVSAGLVQLRPDDRYVAVADVFPRALKELTDQRKVGDPGPPAVAALFRDGRLVSLPRPGALRDQLLEVLAERFATGRTYSEKAVGSVLSEVLDDVVAFRRYLVDRRLLSRDNQGVYWRGSGPRPS